MPPSPPVPQEASRPQSALLAIEHAPSADLLSDRLARSDVDVTRVTNGETARKTLADVSVGILVAEARLPGRTGMELLRLLPPLDPPIILLGRRGNDDEIIRAYEQGAIGYITRPFSPRVAAAQIRRFLTLRDAPPPASSAQSPSRPGDRQ